MLTMTKNKIKQTCWNFKNENAKQTLLDSLAYASVLTNVFSFNVMRKCIRKNSYLQEKQNRGSGKLTSTNSAFSRMFE